MLSKYDGNCGRCERPIAAGSEVKYARHNIWHTSYLECYVSPPVYDGDKVVKAGVLNDPAAQPLSKAEQAIQARIDKVRADRKSAKTPSGKKLDGTTSAAVLAKAAVVTDAIPDFVKSAMLEMSPEASAVFVRSWMAAQA